MAIQGLRDTDGFVTDQRPQNWREGILLTMPNGSAPLTALTSVMKSSSTDDPQYNWWEKKLADQRLQLSANITSSGTDISVSGDALTLMSGHLLYVEETGEIMRVNGDPTSDTSITVVRGYSGTSTSTVDYDGSGVNPNILVIGSAFEEGSDAPTGIGYDPTKLYNYTQIFRNTLEATNTALQTRLRTGDHAKEAKREALQYHSQEMEKAFWFGKRWEGTRNGKPIRTTGGVLDFMNTNQSSHVVDMSSQGSNPETSLEELEEQLLTAFKWGSSEKMAWCGNRALLTIQQIVRKNANYELVQGQKEFGMSVSRLITPFGELVLKHHPLFNLFEGGSTNGSAYQSFNSWVMILDMDNIKYRYLQGRDTKYEKAYQDGGVDGMKAGYITEAGLEIKQPETHMVLKNLYAAASDGSG